MSRRLWLQLCVFMAVGVLGLAAAAAASDKDSRGDNSHSEDSLLRFPGS